MATGPRIVRPVPTPLGLYIRPGANDHTVAVDLLAEERGLMSGFVFDARFDRRHEELRKETLRRNIEAVLDPRIMELAMIGGYSDQLAKLPWAGDEPHRLADFQGNRGNEIVDSICDHVVNRSYSAVLAPTHYLAQGAADPWLSADVDSARRLRARLDAAGCEGTVIYYPLAMPSSIFHDRGQRRLIIERLQRLPFDALWLRIHPFSASSGPLAVRRYIESCRDLHQLRRPVVAERTGTPGLALLGFCAVGGIECGVTIGERFDVSGLLKPRDGRGFMPQSRVYIPSIGLFLDRKQAEQFLESPAMKTAFACHDSSCCKKGTRDMLRDPRRHFLITRMNEIRTLSRQPEPIRPRLYMDDFLRPATDKALRAATNAPKDLRPIFERTRRRLDRWRVTLGPMSQLPAGTALPALPQGQRITVPRSA